MITDVSQLKETTNKIKNIKKKTANDKNAMNQDARNQKIKMKFYATAEISKHVDLMRTWKIFLVFKKMSVSIQLNIYLHSEWLTFKWAHRSNVCIFEYN